IGQRSTILFITFVVIIFTLLIQGLTLPNLIKLIKPAEEEEKNEKELNILLIDQSLLYLKSMNGSTTMTDEIVTGMIEKLKKEETELSKNEISQSTDRIEWRKTYFNIELQLIEFQRKELIKNYYKGEYSLEVIRKKEWELDFWATTVHHEMETLEYKK
ncbi:MAG: Na+/H+ antiporter, partial [Chryseobacterium artocarpi]